MHCGLAWLLLLPPLALGVQTAGQDPASWTIYITNDTCPDYTWGLTEEQTRQSLAELVRAHLDEMARTDGESPENRSRYNMAAAMEALCFLERHPERRQELFRRIREGRLLATPNLNNSLWAFQGLESAIRSLYPGRRLEKEAGVGFSVMHHIELPSLPWGVASILAASGVRWLNIPFLDYDSTFKDLKNPPLFILEGPDGGRIRVVMDAWASRKWNYVQGSRLLREPKLIEQEWLPHYDGLGVSYPLRATLASGTHGDIALKSAGQAAGFTDAIGEYNRAPGPKPRLVNATLPQFFQVVDEAHARAPFLETFRGCFGHSWDLWPVSLAKYAADARAGERAFLAAEALLAVASRVNPAIAAATRVERERAEWNWTMLSDHAWNGTDEANKKVNASLRRRWSEELLRLSESLTRQAWGGLGLAAADRYLTLFNPLSVPRAELVRVEAPAGFNAVMAGSASLPAQIAQEEGRTILHFVSPRISGFGLQTVQLETRTGQPAGGKLRASPTELEGPYYRLRVDTQTGGLASLVWKPAGAELVAGPAGRSLGQTVYFDGKEHTLADVKSEVEATGPVLARLRTTGVCAGIRTTSRVTIYAALDRVDFDIRLSKPVARNQERLIHVFPVARPGATLRIETTGAVIRPLPQPEGDLLPGADARRFAVQGFLDSSLPGGLGVTIAPLDAYALRLDLDPLSFEALGNDQNYKEVSQDQDGVTEFRFRYSLRGHAGGYSGPDAFAWSRSVAAPLPVSFGRPAERVFPPLAEVDPARAIVTCLKPAEEEGIMLRVWETSGRAGPFRIRVPGFRRAFRTDLVERDLEPLRIDNSRAGWTLPAHGFGAVRLVP